MFTRSSFSLNIYTIYISSDITKSVKVSIFLQIPVFPYLWNIILAYNNIANVSRIFYLLSIVHFFIFIRGYVHERFVRILYEFLSRAVQKSWKSSLLSWLFRETQTIRCSLTNRLKPRQWNNPEKKRNRYFPVSVAREKRVAKKINR